MIRIGAWLAVLLSGSTLGPMVSMVCAADPVQRLAELNSRIKPLLAEHCLDCHSGAEPDAGLTLDHFDAPLDFLKGRQVWQKAVQKMLIGEMPPADSSQLSAADRRELMDWINSTIEDFECGLTPNPGQVTLRRLNATEYQNTVRDLMDVNYTPAASFPGDDVGYGFDNIGDVLTLPPLLMEKYFIAAEQISRHVITAPPADTHFEASYAGAELEGAGNGSDGVRVLASSGDATFSEQIPWTGRFQLTITASGDQAGAEPCFMIVAVDGKQVKRFTVRNERNAPQEFEVPIGLRAGNREISIGFLNDFYQAAENGQPGLDRNLAIHHVHLSGTQKSTETLDPKLLSPAHQLLLKMQQQHPGDSAQAAREFLQPLVSRAYRRPVDDEELQRLVDLSLSVESDGGTLEEGIQVALQAILISPKFLFRVEPPRTDSGEAARGVRELDEFELATRLSYFLWSTMPDRELLQLAWQNKLRQGDNMQRQVQRMIQDRRANAFVENFAGQWLTLRKLDGFQPNPHMFPKWTDSINSLARQETLTFFAGIMRNDLSAMRLLDADFTYVNEELAGYYGLPNVAGDEFRMVSLQGTPRAGLLTQASVLAVTSNPTRSSPVKRGKWILDNLLATPPPPAPPGVPELKEKGKLTGSLRQRLEQHRADAACASCHKLMDPLGFALENFDAVGQYRTTDDGLPVDATGLLPSGKKVNGAAELRKVLVEDNRDAFIRCLTEKLLTYALGRGLEYYDKCAVDQVIANAKEDEYRFRRLLTEIVLSDPFQKKGSREGE